MFDAVESGRDLRRPSEIESQPAGSLADLSGGGRRPLRVSPGDDDRLSPAGESFGDDLSDPRRSTDDDGLAAFAHECEEARSKFRSI